MIREPRAPTTVLRPRLRAKARRRLARAFTAIEVLIAMTIMFIGAAAVMTMQKTSIQGNLDARKADVAASIARIWVERIRREAMRWTQPSASSAASNFNITNLPLLGGQVDGGWFRPNSEMGGTIENMSYAFDILGRDLAAADIVSPNVQFCAEAQISTLQTNATYRIDVRVVWPRGIASVPSAGVSGAVAKWPCTSAAVTFDAQLDYTIYHALYVTTAIAESPAQ